MKITILKDGIFGQALANILVKNGHQVFFDSAKETEVVFVCSPSHLVLEMLNDLEEELKDQKIVICSKGFAEDGKFISEILKEKFKRNNSIFFLSGPNLAEELANGVPTGMVIAGGEGKEIIKKILENENLCVTLSNDLVGVEVCMTFKNIITMLVGVVEGMNLGKNTTALILTKGVEEMKKVGLELGAQADTFLGLAGLGDLSLVSRNRLFGRELGKGRKMQQIIEENNYTPAGIFALQNAKIMVQNRKLRMPLTDLLYKIVFENFDLNKFKEEIIKI